VRADGFSSPLSIVVPIIANGFRALGIVWLGHILGSAEAAATDHVLYGSDLLLDRDPVVDGDGPAVSSGQRAGGTIGAAHDTHTGRRLARHGPPRIACGSIGGDGSGRRTGAQSSVGRSGHRFAAARSVTVLRDGWSAGHTVHGTRQCARSSNACGLRRDRADHCDRVFFASVHRRAGQRGTATSDALAEVEDLTETSLASEAGEALRPWRLLRANQPAFVAAAGVWIDGGPMAPGMTMRLAMARDSVTGSSVMPVLVVITPLVDWPHVDPRRKIELEKLVSKLLEARPEIGDQVRAMAAAAR